MTSLANILIVTPMGACPAGDVLWRNADLDKLDYVGVTPSDKQLDELIAVKSGGETGVDLGRLVPDRRQVAYLCLHSAATIRRGVAVNPLVTSAQLGALCADPDTHVAEQAQARKTYLQDLVSRARSGEHAAAVEILDKCLTEQIHALLDNPGSVLSRAMSAVDSTAILSRLGGCASELVDDLCLLVLVDGNAPVPVGVARWMCGDSVAAQAGLAEALTQKATFRRRLTSNALSVLVQAGHLAPTNTVTPPRGAASLDDMALILETAEIAAMYFSSGSPASPGLVTRIMNEAPVGLVVNHLLGQTARHPGAGHVKDMLVNASLERRLAIADAMTATIEKFRQASAAAPGAVNETNPVTTLPWAGELLLGFKRAGTDKLGSDAAVALFQTIDTTLLGNGDAWDYMLALSEEWEETIFDLINSAALMENVS